MKGPKKKKRVWDKNPYKRILEKSEAYADGFVPYLAKELAEKYPYCMVLSVDLLLPSGGRTQIKWSERDSDKVRAQQGREPKP
jgi:hypothetical protein